MSANKPLVVINGQLQQIQSGNTLIGGDGTTAGLFDAATPLHGFGALTSTGIVVKTDAVGGVASRSITSTGSTLTITNGDGVAGNINAEVSATYPGNSSISTVGTITSGTWHGGTIGIAYGGTGAATKQAAFDALSPASATGDLIVFSAGHNVALSAGGAGNTGYVLTNDGAGGISWAATAVSGTVTSVGISTSTSGLTVGSSTTNPITSAGTLTVALNAELQALSQLNQVGLVARTAANTYAEVTLTGTTNYIDVTNGNGTGIPTFTISGTYPGQTSITTLGTIGAGVWNGTIIDVAHGGTGQSTAPTAFNALSPITTTGDLIVGTGSNAAGRLGIGATNQVLTVVAGTPTWAAPATSGTVTSITVTTGTGLLVNGTTSETINTSGTFPLTLSSNLQGLSGLSAAGFVYLDGAGTFSDGNITGTAGRIVIGGTNPNPTIDLATVTNGGGGTVQKLTVDSYGRVSNSSAVVQGDLTTILGSYYLPEAGGTMSGAISMGGFAITGLPTTQSTSATSAASKAYVDAATTALNLHAPVEVATTVELGAIIASSAMVTGHIYTIVTIVGDNYTLSGAASNTIGLSFTYNGTSSGGTGTVDEINVTPGTTDANGGTGIGAKITDTSGTFAALVVDTYTLLLNDRVLVKNQALETLNGIYTITTLGNGTSTSWELTRATDDNDSIANQVSVGDYVFVRDGSVNKNTSWVQTGTGAGASEFPVIGTNNIIYTQFGGAGAYTAGTGLVLSGTTFSVNYGAGIAAVPTGDVGINLYDTSAGALILTTDGSTRGSVAGDKLHLLLTGSGGLAQDSTGLHIPAAGVANTMLANSSIVLDGDLGSTGTISLGGTLSIFGTSNRTSISVSGGTYNVDISSNYVGQTSIITLGTVTTGTWNGTIIDVAHGGTGLSGAAAANGSLLIGNGTGYTLSTLTAGTGISITDGAGSISIANTGVTSVGLTTVDTGVFTTGSAITTTGNLTFSLNPQNQGYVLAAPAVGTGVPTMRALVASDIPTLSAYLTSVTISGGTSGLSTAAAVPGSSTVALTGTLAAVNGGTGQSTYAVGDLLVGGAGNTLAKLAVGTPHQILHGGTTPTYGAVDLTTEVTGALPIANGGTGATTNTAAFNALSPTTTAGDLIVNNGTNNVRLAIGSAGQVLTVVAGSPAWVPATSGETTFVNANTGTISIGEVVYVNSAGKVDLAIATTAATSVAIGIVADTAILTTASGNVAMSGVVNGLTGLTPGATYFLSDITAGLLTTTAPTTAGHFIAPIGIAISSTALKINIQSTIML
jgi:hypothetical protein